MKARHYIPPDLMFINISLHHAALTILLGHRYNMYMKLVNNYEITMSLMFEALPIGLPTSFLMLLPGLVGLIKHNYLQAHVHDITWNHCGWFTLV